MSRILIIEDDDFMQNMLKQTFERSGYDVATAANGKIGLEMYDSNSFDVVITDLLMPEMEGIETLINLRKKNERVKVIAISGGGRNSPENYLLMAEKLGAQKTFPKPIDRQGLLSAVKEMID